MKSTDQTRALQAYLKSIHAEAPCALGNACPEPPVWGDPITHQMVFSFLLWRATAKQANAAMKKLLESVVDYNEMRICLPHELVEMIGSRHPHAEERVIRMRATLNDVYSTEHTIGLSRLSTIGKRDAKAMLDELDGIPSFVSARVALLSLNCHAFPVDERILALLKEEGVLAPKTTCDSASSWLERQIRAGEAESIYLLTEKRLAARPASRTPKIKATRQPHKTTAKQPASKGSGDQAKTNKQRTS